MITFLQALVLGLVEGITEFLPISSTGHLILTARLLQIAESDFLKSFEIVIQLGAILAIVILYAQRLLADKGLLKRVAVAFVPTGILGLLLYKIIKQYLLGNALVVVVALALGGLGLIIFERWYERRTRVVVAKPLDQMTWRDAVLVGCAQSLAMIPGVSRSAATIVGGMTLGYSRAAIVEFSFLLAVPTMAAATGFDLLKNYSLFSVSQIGILAVGFVMAFVTALVVVRWLTGFVKQHTFEAFGWYRLALAGLYWLVFLR